MAVDNFGPEHEFVKPKKEVTQESFMVKWQNSKAYQDYYGFLVTMNEAVKNKPLSAACEESDTVTGLLEILKSLREILEETPPLQQQQRYGNAAFRSWYEKLKSNAPNLLKSALSEEFHSAIPEIVEYLVEGFGNVTRIDYGTGHEMSFCMFLCCLFKIGALRLARDSVATVNKVFATYMDLVRRLQMTYRMEPAGSQGVWSLDDFQFVPFIWGSAQLVGQQKIEPCMFLQGSVVDKYAPEYMFFGCVKYINTVKSGNFAEHSNQLWNISNISSWSRINDGLFKMYKGEVLSKFPVIQHVLFGSILSFEPVSNAEPSSR